MEEQISPLIQSILSTIQNHEKQTSEELENFKKVLKEKEITILELRELNSKLKSEMEDFLKVSFASRWKKKSEELEKKNIYLEDKIHKLTTTNQELNYKLDKMSEQKDVTIQTDQCTLTIKTNKGSIYSLTDNKLLTAAGVIAGTVI